MNTQMQGFFVAFVNKLEAVHLKAAAFNARVILSVAHTDPEAAWAGAGNAPPLPTGWTKRWVDDSCIDCNFSSNVEIYSITD